MSVNCDSKFSPDTGNNVSHVVKTAGMALFCAVENKLQNAW
jgi:hypothetical protein